MRTQQRGYLGMMKSFQVFNSMVEYSLIFIFHRTVVAFDRAGAFEKLCDVRSPVDEKKGSFVTRLGVGLSYYMITVMVFYSLVTLPYMPLLYAQVIDADAYQHNPPFNVGLNWTVATAITGCDIHAITDGNAATSYTNVTEAQLKCLELGPDVCAGVHAARCDGAVEQFRLCDARWMPIPMPGDPTTCVAVAPAALSWLDSQCDPFPNWMDMSVYIYPWILHGHLQMVLAGSNGLASIAMALSYVLVSSAAVNHIKSSVRKAQAVDTTDLQAANVAMSELVRLEEEIIGPINTGWGRHITAWFTIVFLKALYYALSTSFGIDVGAVVRRHDPLHSLLLPIMSILKQDNSCSDVLSAMHVWTGRVCVRAGHHIVHLGAPRVGAGRSCDLGMCEADGRLQSHAISQR